ncbi:DUF3179 domain-containing (seleno)protein [Cecembia calidifontis]|jgi:hypothetical protein|uniref:Uncharacterized protein DUF3179 n=1 Tax=Cecembia calidifontis TaxID=1187080 RepID=A0A4Q7PAG9_9BACT|nr:DUF3179 domain-containing (seleno)protein [Cecembia calidifontis]RZS95752.1 uncharacterized protein DUF3179 [Cecembia calidifontis]
MKKYFFIGIVGLALLEIGRIYFIMPMPGSQKWDSLHLAYFLHSYRWTGIFLFGAMLLIGAKSAFASSKWLSGILTLHLLGFIYMFNFKMTADKMFLQPENLTFSSFEENSLVDSSLVLVASYKGEAKAYPIRYIAYHHQVRDQIGGKDIMVTYCSVCRSGRIFEPVVNGQTENFRLVGMDHFNAMFEDQSTGSWWQQANWEAVTGPLKGYQLPELASSQMSLGKFFSLYPSGQVMNGDPKFLSKYDSLGKFEFGLSKSKLTGTDSLSWKQKSWVVGVRINGKTKAFDWNDLKAQQIILDQLAGKPIALVISEDRNSFRVFLRPSNQHKIKLIPGDKIIFNEDTLNFNGVNIKTGAQELISITAYQEFWHSWKTFNPGTEIYSPK